MNAIGYALAALALFAAFPLIRKGIAASYTAWKSDAAKLYSWSQGAGGYLANKDGWLKFAAGMLTASVICYVLTQGVKLPTIPDWLTPDIVVTPTGEFRAFIVREVGDKLTREQENAINSSTITAYLNDKAAKIDGRPAWRRWDDDTDTSNESPAINALWERAKATPDATPKLVVFVGDRMSVHPIVTEADTLATLKKIGGE